MGISAALNHQARAADKAAAATVLCAFLACLAGTARAEVDMTRYRSAEEAEAAIARSTAQAAQVQQDYVNQSRVCYQKFFTTSCLDEAIERRRAALHTLKDTEVDARAWLRKNRAQQRDAALEEKRISDERDWQERQADIKAREEALERKRLSSEERQREVARRQAEQVPDTRVQQHRQAERERQARAAREAPERARYVEAYQRKQQEAADRQRKPTP